MIKHHLLTHQPHQQQKQEFMTGLHTDSSRRHRHHLLHSPASPLSDDLKSKQQQQMGDTRAEENPIKQPLRSFLIDDILKHTPKKPRPNDSPVSDGGEHDRESPNRRDLDGLNSSSTSNSRDGPLPPPLWPPPSWPYTCASRILDRRSPFGPMFLPNHPHFIPHYFHHHLSSRSSSSPPSAASASSGRLHHPGSTISSPPLPSSLAASASSSHHNHAMNNNLSSGLHGLSRQRLAQHEKESSSSQRGDSDEGGRDGDDDDAYSTSETSSDISITGSSPPPSKKHSHSDPGVIMNGHDNNSPLDALFALTTKALDRVNSKSEEPHSKHMYKDGMSQVKKKRKSRTAFTNTQIFELEKRFLYQKYLSPADRDELASGLGLTGAQVITWFQNRRAKLKRDVEEIKKDVEATKMNFGVPTTPSPLLAGFEHDSFAVSKKAAELRVLMHLEQINNKR